MAKATECPISAGSRASAHMPGSAPSPLRTQSWQCTDRGALCLAGRHGFQPLL